MRREEEGADNMVVVRYPMGKFASMSSKMGTYKADERVSQK